MSDERLAATLFGTPGPPAPADSHVAAHLSAIRNGLIASTPAREISDDHLANTLFGGSTETTTVQREQHDVGDRAHASAPADTAGAAPDAPTDRVADLLFGDPATVYEPTFAEHRGTLQEIGFGAEELAQGEAVIVRTAHEHQFTVDDTRHIFNAWAEARLQAERGSIPNDELERQARQEEDAHAALRARYGAQEADDLIERTARFVDRVPALRDALSVGYLGSRPDVVERLVAHVHRHDIR
jgi:hypothetical protein